VASLADALDAADARASGRNDPRTRARRLLERLRGSGVDEVARLADLRRNGIFQVGRYTYGTPKVLTFGSSASVYVDIGAFCSIAEGVEFVLDGELHAEWVTTYPLRLQRQLEGAMRDGHPTSRGPIHVGNDVWLARGALILSGVRIGDGAVIGARALVSRDVPPYAIFAGNPARVRRQRFSPAVVDELLRIRWWEWPIDRIREAVPLLSDPDVERFIRHFGAVDPKR